jgi:hypothetical protein
MSDFTYNPAVEKQLLRDPNMAQMLATYAEAGAENARADAPTGHRHRGLHYRDSIHAAVGVDGRGPFGRVFSVDFAAHLVEFGSVHNPAYAPLRRGVEATGLRVTDRGKRAA